MMRLLECCPFSSRSIGTAVSKQYPECPLYNHVNCKEYENPTLCAIVREDKICTKKKANKCSKIK
jgi:hypothetical protein